MSSSLKTTRRAQQSDIQIRDNAQLAIHWLFPIDKAAFTFLNGPSMLFGRADECDFVLDGSEASRHHAEVRQEGPLFFLIDLDSTNGVFINGKKVASAPLTIKSVIRLGEWVGIVTTATCDANEHSVNLRAIGPRLYGGTRLAMTMAPAIRAANTDLPVIIQGETGTGKECVARAIHTWSNRSRSFIAVNCSTLPETLAESHLFGQPRGAFTGAVPRLGYFRAAEAGTLLLDEITDLPLPIQPKLLRVLEQKEVVPVGEATPVPVNVRIITATQEPLDRAVSEKRFRADLFARLDGLTVTLPPLRDRIEDVPGLFLHFLREHSGGQIPQIEPKLVEQLLLYDWPFNVRELERLAQSLLVVHGNEPLLRRSHLPERMAQRSVVDQNASEETVKQLIPDRNASQSLKSKDRDESIAALVAALRAHQGNVSRAAKALGIPKTNAYRLMDGLQEFDLNALRQSSKPPDGKSGK